MTIPEGLTPTQTVPEGLSPVDTVPTGLTPVSEEEPSVIGDIATQMPVGVARAYDEFASTLATVANEVTGWFGKPTEFTNDDIWRNMKAAVPFIGQELSETELPDLPEAQTMPGAIAGGLTQAGTGFLLARKVVPSSAIKNKTLQMMMAGALTDFGFFDPYEKRLTNIMAESDTAFNNTLTQWLAADEDDSELEARMKQMLEGGMVGLAADRVIEGFRYVKGITKARTDMKRAGALMDKLQDKVTDNVRQGLNQEEALFRALRSAGIEKDEVFDAALKTGRDIDFKDITPSTKEVSKTVQKAKSDLLKERVFNVGKTALEKTDVALGALRTRINNYSPELGFRLQRFEYDSATMAHRALEQVQPFLKGLSKLKRKEKDIYNNISIRLFNQDYKGVEELIDNIKNVKVQEQLRSGFRSTKTVLRSLYDAEKSVNPDIGFLDDYFPRAVKDYKRLAKHMGFSSSELDRHLKKASDVKGRNLTNTELAEEINKFTRGLGAPKQGIKKPDGTKIRQVQYLKSGDLPFYASPEESLTEYIHHVTHHVQKRKFFGYGGDNLDDSVGNLLGTMRAQGKLNGEDIDALTDLLTARFGKGEQAASVAGQNLKNGFYAVTLNDPTNAVTQVGDIMIAAHRHGVARVMKQTAKEIAATITGNRKLHMRDLGLDRISEEFASTTATAKYINRLFRVTGFKQIDTIGKNVHINSSLNKFQNWMKTPKGRQKFVEKYGAAFDEADLAKVMDDLKAGNITGDTKFIAFNELADVQPITLSEMPQYYLEHPSLGRLLYTLRSFTLKQFDVLRQDAYNEIKKGNVAKGTGNLFRYATLFTIGGMGADQVKAWMLGKDVDPKENFTNNLLKMLGLSTYIVDKAKDDKASTIISSVLLPPIGAGTDPIVNDLRNWDGIQESLKIAPYGKMLYNYFGGGLEKSKEWERKRERRELRERLRGE